MENHEKMYDMIIVGGGPAGLSAAIYMSRAKYKTLVIEKEKFGGQITITSEIVNYPGVFSTSGEELTKGMQKQAESFGAEFLMDEVLDMDLKSDIKTIKTKNGEYKTLGVILALGASPRQIGFQGESEYKGRGVAYCATCDGEFFQDMPVYVVGGGFAAVEEGIFLTKYASSVHMIVREPDFTAAKAVAEKVYDHDKIKVTFNTEVGYIKGEGSLNEIKLINNENGKEEIINHENGFGVFVFAGYAPNTKWLKDVDLTEDGYIVTDKYRRTNIPGVYGAGDVCVKQLRQVVTAVSDGASAATDAEKHVEELHKKLNLPPFEMKTTKIKNSPSSSEHETPRTNDGSFIDSEMKEQLAGVFARFENEVTVNAVIDGSDLGKEMENFIAELEGISPMVKCSKSTLDEGTIPYLEILNNSGNPSGIRYFAMPGGHEFNSFILALYNIAGPGKQLDPDILERIQKIDKKINIQVLISLSCTMCPDVVVATQQIAGKNSNVTAHALDLGFFPELKQKHNIMSVPCMIINDEIVNFGKKDIGQILNIIDSI